MDFFNYLPEEKKLLEIRKQLYSSDQPGFYVFKNFISQGFVDHMRYFWLNEAPKSKVHKQLTGHIDKAKVFYEGCPNYFAITSYGTAYYNFFWNAPIDEAAHAVSFAINALRNAVEANNNYEFFYPINGNSCSYRIVNTKKGSPVPPHTDWMGEKNFTPKRLQATLILSKKGVDYDGDGMKMLSNDKKNRLVFDSADIPVNPGDLVLWRYNNEHSVDNVSTKEGQIGYLRMIFPPEFIATKPRELTLSAFSAKELSNGLLNKIKKKFIK